MACLYRSWRGGTMRSRRHLWRKAATAPAHAAKMRTTTPSSAGCMRKLTKCTLATPGQYTRQRLVDSATTSTPHSVASELWGQGVHCTLQVQNLYPLYPPSQRCGLCQNFKQTTLTTRLYKDRTNLYPPTYENVPKRLPALDRSELN